MEIDPYGVLVRHRKVAENRNGPLLAIDPNSELIGSSPTGSLMSVTCPRRGSGQRAREQVVIAAEKSLDHDGFFGSDVEHSETPPVDMETPNGVCVLYLVGY